MTRLTDAVTEDFGADPELTYYDSNVTWTESWPGFVSDPFGPSTPSPRRSATDREI